MPYVVKIGSFVVILPTAREVLRMLKQLPVDGELIITDLDGKQISLASIREVAEAKPDQN